MISSFTGKYAFLSNFYFSEVIYEGARYPTVEHAYQASKSTDLSVRERVAALRTPGEAKKYGRRVALRADWEQVKVGVMRELLRWKFSRLDLLAQLVATGDEVLVEGNYWGDRFWGQCPVGVGENWLGRLLMGVRDEGRST